MNIATKRGLSALILEVNGISKKFGAKTVLNDVSFTVGSGEILGFVGPNGAGKTTAIKVILGLLRADSGTVVINGYNVSEDHENALRNVGAIIESPELYRYLTGYENLMQSARIYGISEDRVSEVAKEVGLGNRINDKVKTYSLGMRQRLGVAQAILHNPNLLLLDEPTNGLDPEGIKELRDTLKTLAAKGAGILVSSHMLSELELMCNSICIIENGIITARRSASDMYDEKEIFVFDVDNIHKTSQIISGKGIKSETDGKYITALLKKEQVPEIIKALVTENVLIYSVSKKHKSLEETYLEYTSDSKRGGGIS